MIIAPKRLPTPLAILLSLAASTAQATGLDDLQHLMSEMEGGDEMYLLGIVEEETTIATRTKLNADYVPGIITILRGEVMQARGATTVVEALALLPGIEQSHDRIGTQTTLIRGIGGSFVSGNMKVLLDHVSMNAAISGHAEAVMMLPIEQVERIEVIRGPGAALYGEFAYAGVVNIITRKDKSAVFVGVGSFGKQTLGVSLSPTLSNPDLKFSLNLAGWQQDDSNTQAGKDALYQGTPATLGQSALSNAPGPINDQRHSRSALLNLSYQDIALQMQAVDSGHGDYFGTFDVLPEHDEGTAYDNKQRTIELKKQSAISDSFSSEFTVGLQRYDSGFDMTIVPDGYLGAYINGWDAYSHYREERLYSSLDLRWSSLSNHKLLASFSASNTDVSDAWQVSNVDPVTAAPVAGPTLFTGDKNWVNEDKQRDIRSLVLQDEYSYGEKTTYTLGVRYDDYTDVGYNIAPRLATVYRHSDEHIFKAQYAEAFRPPTFHEEWNSTANAIEPETINTFELAYINRLWDQVNRISLFHSELKDLIVFEGLLDYRNLHDAKSTGFELESERYLLEWIKLNANISYNDTVNSSTNKRFNGAAKWLSNIGIMMDNNSGLTLATELSFVGNREREVNINDPRNRLGSYYLLNSTLTYALPNSGLSLRIGINNLLDREIVYPAMMTWDSIASTPMLSYADDYPQPGRNGWLQLNYNF